MSFKGLSKLIIELAKPMSLALSWWQLKRKPTQSGLCEWILIKFGKAQKVHDQK